jgi:hypothetical protein
VIPHRCSGEPPKRVLHWGFGFNRLLTWSARGAVSCYCWRVLAGLADAVGCAVSSRLRQLHARTCGIGENAANHELNGLSGVRLG